MISGKLIVPADPLILSSLPDWLSDPKWTGVGVLIPILIVIFGVIWRGRLGQVLTGKPEAPQKVEIVPPVAPAPPPKPKPPTILLGPVALDRTVKGRTVEITALREALEYGGAAAIVKGQGGIGKTTLARAYVDRYRDSYRGVIWLRAEEDTTLIDDLLMLAPVLGQAQDASVPKPVRARAALDGLPAGWLVVYDNAENDKALTGWLANPPVHVLVTSRYGAWPGRFTEIAPDALRFATPDDPAPQLLMQEAGRADDPAGARDLAEALGGLPLALVAAGGLIREEGGSFADYGAGLEAILKERASGDYKAADADFPDSVWAAVKLSYDALPEDARTVLDLFAWFAPEGLETWLLTDVATGNGSWNSDDLPPELKALCADPERVTAALRAAMRQSLLRREEAGYSLHRMSGAALRALQALAGRGETVATMAAAVMAAGYPGGSRSPAYSENWPDCARLTPHVLALEAAGAPATAAAEYLFNQASIYLRHMAEPGTALRLAEATLRMKRSRLPDRDPEVARGWSVLGVARLQAGDAAGAVAACSEAVRLIETYEKKSDFSLAAYNNQAVALQMLGRATGKRALLEQALTLMEKVSKLRESSLGPESEEVAASLTNLAESQNALGYWAAALKASGRALAIRRKLVAAGEMPAGNRGWRSR